MKKKSAKKTENKKTNYVIYGVVAGVALVLILSFFIIPIFSEEESNETTQEQSYTDLSQVIAKVNGEEITNNDLQETKMIVQQQTGQIGDDTFILENLISQVLLTQKAKQTIEFSTQDVEQIISEDLALQNMTLEQYKQQIEMMGQDYNDQIESIKEQLILSQYFQENLQAPEITEQEIDEFYQENKILIEQQLPNSSYQEIKPMIESELQQIKVQEEIQKLIERLKQNATIEIYQENLEAPKQQEIILDDLA